jgi:hypothetical protein
MATAKSKGFTDNTVVGGFTTADYESLTEDDAKAARGDDGSLPTKFARLKSGSSVLVGKGISVSTIATDIYRKVVADYPFLASELNDGTDIGPYKYATATAVEQQVMEIAPQTSFDVKCDGEIVRMVYSVENQGDVELSLMSVEGKTLAKLVRSAEPQVKYDVPMSAEDLPHGIIFAVCKNAGRSYVKKISVK